MTETGLLYRLNFETKMSEKANKFRVFVCLISYYDKLMEKCDLLQWSAGM